MFYNEFYPLMSDYPPHTSVDVVVELVVVVYVEVVTKFVVVCAAATALWVIEADAKKTPPITSITIDSPRITIPTLFIFISQHLFNIFLNFSRNIVFSEFYESSKP